MSAKLKLVSNNCEPSEIAVLTKRGKWKDIQEMNIDNYVYEVSPNEYAPKMNSIIQSRMVTYNPELVAMNVRKSKSGVSFSEPSTIVYFPEETVIDGEVIPANSYRLVGGVHGMTTDKYMGATKKLCNIVNYKHDLDSNEGKLFRLGNCLNIVNKEEQGLEDGAIKNEIYRLMDRRISEGKEAKPSAEERQSFFDDYSQIDDRQWSNWLSNHTEGGRKSPNIAYSRDELQATRLALTKLKQYEDYIIPMPTTVKSWSGEALGRAILECCEGYTDSNGTKVKPKKLLIPLYASNRKQYEDLKDGKLEKQIKSKFKELEGFLRFDALEHTMLKY